jgi:hypothetical protein
MPAHLQPWQLQADGRDHIGKQGQRQPLEHMHIAVVGQQHLQQQRQQAGSGGIPVAGAACEQADGLAHGGNVGRDVDGVGHQQQLTMAYSSGRGRWRRILVASPRR